MMRAAVAVAEREGGRGSREERTGGTAAGLSLGCVTGSGFAGEPRGDGPASRREIGLITYQSAKFNKVILSDKEEMMYMKEVLALTKFLDALHFTDVDYASVTSRITANSWRHGEVETHQDVKPW